MLVLLVLLATLLGACQAATFPISWGFDTSKASARVYVGDTIQWDLNQDDNTHLLRCPQISQFMTFGGNFSAGTVYGLDVPSSIPPGTYTVVGQITSMTSTIVILGGARPTAAGLALMFLLF
jgi:hypothetical protein